MNRIQKVALAYLAFIAVLSWGIGIGRHRIFPYRYIQEVVAFAQGADDQTVTVVGSLQNDLNLKPARFIYQYPVVAGEAYKELAIPGLRGRRAAPRIYLAQDLPRAYRAIFGAFDFERSFWGAVLIDAEGRVVHQWYLSSEDLPQNTEPDIRKNLYGVSLLPDGSVIFSMQETAGGIVRVDYCSKRIWSLEGHFHHVAALTDEDTFWTFEGSQFDFDHVLDMVSVATGRVLKKIDMKDVRAANPSVHIFDLQKQENVKDAVHGNDIEALPLRLAPDFPQFQHGDLLVSFRTTNLVFVLDPDTLKIKWWRVGAWDRQHDPDWNKGGRISVFSNNERASRKYSDIIAIDPRTLTAATLVDGSEHQFLSTINGNHQMTDNGTILIASSTQGRVFEVDGADRVVFDFINTYDERAKEALHVSEALSLRPDFFQVKLPECGRS